MKNPSYAQLVQAITAILPRASFDEDLEGQLIIYTDLAQVSTDDSAPLQDHFVYGQADETD